MINKQAKRNIFNTIKEISNLLVIEDVMSILNRKHDHAFISYDNVVIYGADNIREFRKLIDKIWSKNYFFRNNFTREKTLRKIIELASLKEELSHEDVYSWLDSIKEQEVKSLWIYREIQGAELSENKIVELGPFCIVDKSHHKDVIVNKSSHIDSNWEHIWNHIKGNLLIRVKVSALNIDRGYELANIQFELFENIIKFIIPNNKEYDISIVNHVEPPISMSFAIADNSYSRSFSRSMKGSEPINFNSSIFSNTNPWVQDIFSLLEKMHRSDVENRMLRAIEWVGKGLRDIDKEKGFIQLMFAIETLLSYRGESVIQPSILSRISECIAFTLGNDYSSRARLEKDFKYLYGIRSAIAHGSERIVTESDFMLLRDMIVNLIWAFIENDDLRKCKKIEDYNEWVKKKRYDF